MSIDRDPTHALSIRQPWAWLICSGLKDIENRSWKSARIGPFFIHAGQRVDRDALECLRRGIHPVTGDVCAIRVPEQLPTGGIVGRATVVDCVAVSLSPWFVGQYGFVLRDAEQMAFVPCRGALGWFRPEIKAHEGVS